MGIIKNNYLSPVFLRPICPRYKRLAHLLLLSVACWSSSVAALASSPQPDATMDISGIPIRPTELAGGVRPVAVLVAQSAAPKIVKIRVAYQSLTTGSAYPLSNEPIKLIVLVWVEGKRLPYSGESIPNTSSHPIWMTGTKGFGVSGPNMVYNELGKFGDGRTANGEYYPERLPAPGGYQTKSSLKKGTTYKIYEDSYNEVSKWPAEWGEPNIDWYELGLLVDKTKDGKGRGSNRNFTFTDIHGKKKNHFTGFKNAKPFISGKNKWVLLFAQPKSGNHSITSGTHRYAVQVRVPGPRPPKEMQDSLAGVSPKSGIYLGAYSTRVSVRNGDIDDMFLQYASMIENTPYSFGGHSFGGSTGWDGGNSTRHGIDCSGFVAMAYHFANWKYKKGDALGRRTDTVSLAFGGGVVPTTKIEAKQLAPGDIMDKIKYDEKAKRWVGRHVRIVYERNPSNDTYTSIEAMPNSTQRVSGRLVSESGYRPRRLPFRFTSKYKEAEKQIYLAAKPSESIEPITPTPVPVVTPPRKPTVPTIPVKPSENSNTTSTRNLPVTSGPGVVRPEPKPKVPEKPRLIIYPPRIEKPEFSAKTPVTTVYLNGKRVPFTSPPFNHRGVPMAQLRPLLESADFTVEWVVNRISRRRSERRVQATKDEQTVVIVLRNRTSTFVRVSGQKVTPSRSPRIRRSRTVIPISLLRSLGWQVTYDVKTGRVDIGTTP